MKKIKWLVAVAFAVPITCCNQNKKNTAAVSEDNKLTAVEEPVPITSSATFTINNKKFTCGEVGAVAYKKDNSIVISGKSSAEGESIFFSFTLKEIGEGQKKFNTAGNVIEFTTTETFTNNYKDDCTGENTLTNGMITITKLVDYTAEKDGRVEGNFEGQLSITRPVAPYPCANGRTANNKTELVTIKGNFEGGYINTKDVPL